MRPYFETMRLRPVLLAAAATAVLVLSGCVPALQGLARVNGDESIDVILCGDYESATLEFDFYVSDEWDGDFEWSATAPSDQVIGLRVVSFGDPPDGWTTEVLDEIPAEWDTLDVNLDIGPGPSFDRSDLRVGEWVWSGGGIFTQGRCDDARALVD